MSNEYAIEVKGLEKSYKNLPVLKGIDFAVKRGTMTALLGPNGAGKTTTVRILSTLLLPDAGRLTVKGYDVVKEAAKVRSVLGLTGQYAAVDDYLTGEENLYMMGRLYHLGYRDIRQRSRELLALFDLTQAARRPVKTYSSGMCRRLDLAISLIASPPILFLDEPTTGLDPRSRLIMWNIIRQLTAAGTTILLTTQDMNEADQLADKIVVIDNGKVIAEGTAGELKLRVGSERLEITLAGKNSAEAVKQAIKPDNFYFDPDTQTLSLATGDGVHQCRQIFDKLEQAGIKIESMSFHRPTLDDVFLSLTGHTTEQPETAQAKTTGGE